MQVYEVVKDVKNDRWAIRRIGEKEFVETFNAFSVAFRVCTQMNETFNLKKETD